MPDPTNDNDIDALLHLLQDPHHSRHSTALRRLVAERNALKEENIALRSRQKSHQDEVLDRVFEMDALRKRIAELEAPIRNPLSRALELEEALRHPKKEGGGA